MNCNVTGNIVGQIARTRRRFQAPYLLEFVGESRRYISGHHDLGHSSIELTVKLYGRFSDDAREKWKWIELLDEPMEAVAKRRMLTVVEGTATRR
jgi:hypothetical protein